VRKAAITTLYTNVLIRHCRRHLISEERRRIFQLHPVLPIYSGMLCIDIPATILLAGFR
jgi:hypothetical protein